MNLVKTTHLSSLFYLQCELFLAYQITRRSKMRFGIAKPKSLPLKAEVYRLTKTRQVFPSQDIRILESDLEAPNR
jgi:hypothetical protein